MRVPGPASDIRMTLPAPNCVLGVRFQNGVVRRIVEGPGVRPWFQDFTLFMGLKNDGMDSWPAILFFRKKRFGEKLCKAFLKQLQDVLVAELPGEEWTPEKIGTLCVWSHADTKNLLCELDCATGREKCVLQMRYGAHLIQQQTIISGGGVFFHAALVKKGSRAVLLAGPSGTGKSTCVQRLPEPWTALSDDSVLVVPDQEGGFWAHPFPTWSACQEGACEKRWDIQSAVPLAAVFFLYQSHQDQVLPLGQSRVLFLVFRMMQVLNRAICPYGSSREKEQTHLMFFNNAARLANTIPGFSLGVSRFGSFWKAMENVLG